MWCQIPVLVPLLLFDLDLQHEPETSWEWNCWKQKRYTRYANKVSQTNISITKIQFQAELIRNFSQSERWVTLMLKKVINQSVSTVDISDIYPLGPLVYQQWHHFTCSWNTKHNFYTNRCMISGNMTRIWFSDRISWGDGGGEDISIFSH